MADPLIQAGINADWSVFAHPSYGYWVQAPPSANLQMPVSLGSIGPPTPGNYVDVQVQYENPSTALYEIAYESVSNGNWYEGAWTYGFGQNTLGRSSTAEWIVEDTCIWPGNLWAFSQFGVVPFTDLDATCKGSWDPLSDFSKNLYKFRMLDKGLAPVALTNYPVSGWDFEVVNTKGTVNAPMGSCSM
jgi:hypothetical protein